MTDDIIIVYCSCPTKELALKISGLLIEQKFAACVKVTSPMTAIYLWQGQVCQGEEVILMIKSTQNRQQDIQRLIQRYHTYECPEILVVPVVSGSAEYLQWVRQTTAE